MKFENIRYFELTFINDLDEIKKQIKNTILFLYLAENHGLTFLSEYLEDTQYGYTASAKSDGEIKLLRITDITEGKVNWDSVPYCDCDKPDKYLLSNNDILVARTGGTTGKSFIVKDVPINIVYASYLIRLRLKKENNAEFISAFLNSYTYWSQLVELKRGAAQPNVNAEKLKKIIIPKCSTDVQDRFVSFLNGNIIDEELDIRIKGVLTLFDANQLLKEEQSTQLDLLKKLRKQILQDAVQGKLVPQDPNDEPASKLLERIKAEKEQLIKEKKIKKEKSLPEIKPEEIPFEIPENWVWCRLGDVCSKIGSGSTPNGSNYSNTGLPFFRSQNIQDRGLIYDDIKFISNEVHNQMNGTVVNPLDILLNITGGSLGRCAIVPNDFIEGNVSQHVCIIRPISLFNSFIHSVVLSPYFQRLIFESTTGAGREGLPKYNLEKFIVPIPPFSQQIRIIIKIEQLLKRCAELEQTIIQNQKYTQDLLQVALKEALEPKTT